MELNSQVVRRMEWPELQKTASTARAIKKTLREQMLEREKDEVTGEFYD